MAGAVAEAIFDRDVDGPKHHFIKVFPGTCCNWIYRLAGQGGQGEQKVPEVLKAERGGG